MQQPLKCVLAESLMTKCEFSINLLTFKKKKKKHDAVLCSMSTKAVSTSTIATFFCNICSYFIVVSGKKVEP